MESLTSIISPGMRRIKKKTMRLTRNTVGSIGSTGVNPWAGYIGLGRFGMVKCPVIGAERPLP